MCCAAACPTTGPPFLDRLQREGKVFEHWYHAAAYLPMRDYRFALRRMQAFKNREIGWERSSDQQLMARILDRVRIDGPLKSRDFEDTRPSREPAGGTGSPPSGPWSSSSSKAT